MLQTEFAKLDFSKYDRLFTIGCSFTNWIWPTWANIIAKQNDHLEHFNYGNPGCGNEYILLMLNQLMHQYELGKKDLVIIMWSTFHRLSAYDSYKGKQDKAIIDNQPLTSVKKTPYNWKSGSDLISQQLLDETTTSCDRGFAIKNYGYIDIATNIIESSEFTGMQMLSVGPMSQKNFDETSIDTYKDDVHKFYSHLKNKLTGMPLYSFLDHANNRHVWSKPSGEIAEDYHPYPNHYAGYLSNIGFIINEETQNWINKCETRIFNTADPAELENDPNWGFSYFPNREKFPL